MVIYTTVNWSPEPRERVGRSDDVGPLGGWLVQASALHPNGKRQRWPTTRALRATSSDSLGAGNKRPRTVDNGTNVQQWTSQRNNKSLSVFVNRVAKRRKYENLYSSFIFVPFGVETLGPWGPEARALFKELSKRVIESTGEPRAGSYLGQRISLAIRRGNAASILGTVPRCGGFKDVLDFI
ncbi:jg3326 [Pararge aegeria aegeria]|uniref:Jg3326 protein n=1 Tax=Pararge aegeria aegeria TaxID=348720 RepID=A0A8S4RVK2_9NEOP|nr:jg3326 [Pararge aegeria aegeria]